MTKRKSTKSALFSSVLALFLCFTMLLGTTFAWFTDTVTSGSNIIKTGNLDLVLEYWDGESWVDAEGKVIPFVAADGRSEILWEPGCTYEMAPFRIRNEGSLSAKLIVLLNGVEGDEKLMEAIELKTRINNIPESVLNGSAANQLQKFEDAEVGVLYGMPEGNVLFDWSLAGKGEVTPGTGHTDTSPEFTVFGHMAEEAGNEYMDLAIEGVSISVIATQQMYEYDSFGKDYDKDAPYPILASTAADLRDAMKTDGANIVLTDDITVTPNDTTGYGQHMFLANGKDVTIDLNGKNIVLSEDAMQVNSLFSSANGGSITIKGEGNVEIKNGKAFVCWTMNDTDQVNVYGGNYISNGHEGNNALFYVQAGKIDVYGGKFSYPVADNDNWGFNARDALGNVVVIEIHEGVLLQHEQFQYGDSSRIKLAEGCSLKETVIDGETWYQVVK